MRFLRNREELVDMLLPVLADWASVEGYVMPSKYYLLKFDIELHDGDRFLSNTNMARVLANIQQSTQVMCLAMEHDNDSLISSVTHEFAHAIQFYNLGAQFSPQYSQATAVSGYTGNIFEIQARNAEACLRAHKARNTFLVRAIAAFKWLSEVADLAAWAESYYEKPRFRDWEQQGFWRTYKERRK